MGGGEGEVVEGVLEVGERQKGGLKKLDGLHWIMAKEKEKKTLKMVVGKSCITFAGAWEVLLGL